MTTMVIMEIFMPISLNIEKGINVNIKLDKDGLYKSYINDMEIGIGKKVSSKKSLKNNFIGTVISCDKHILKVRLNNPFL